MVKGSEICTEERLEQLQKAMQSIETDPQTRRTKIQKVPNYLRENQEFGKYYFPKLLSIGPIHHGRENLKHGEQYKLLWTANYLKETDQDPVDLCQRIVDHIEELKGLYTMDAIGNNNNKELVWMLFVDGCSVLQFIEKLDIKHPEELKIKIDQQEHMHRDLLLLENQVPYRVLELLSNKRDETLLKSMLNFASGGLAKSRIFHEDYVVKLPEDRQPYHLLDFVRSELLMVDIDTEKRMRKLEVLNSRPKQKGNGHVFPVWPTYKNIRDLKKAGIRVKKEEKPGWSKISFTSHCFCGELKLPWFVVDASAPYTYLNMIAYEACPDFQNNYQISSIFAFFDSLIDDANDVKELRSAGVIQNLLGSDDEVAKLFNGIGNDLAAKQFNILSSNTIVYSKECIRVKYEIEKHYKNKWKTWMALAYNTHFSNPWSIFAFLAALLALVLTLIQTWFTIHPYN